MSTPTVKITALLLAQAFERHSTTEISMPGSKKEWKECVTFEPSMNSWYLWYNTVDSSTLVVSIPKERMN
jgi:uncharacterized protein involved in tolerance to divalent cations